MNREELKLTEEWLDLQESYQALKERRMDPDDDLTVDDEEWQAKVRELDEFRTKWRQVREAFSQPPAEEDADAVATPQAIEATARSGEEAGN